MATPSFPGFGFGGGFGGAGYLPSSGGDTGINWAKWSPYIMGGAALLSNFLGPKSLDPTSTIQNLEKSGQAGINLGTSLTNEGQQALEPALRFYERLLSGNQADIQAATAPERSRIIDQYDTAKRTIANTSPRGGGQTVALGNANIQQAKDLATLPMAARQGAAEASASIAGNLISAGEQATSTGQSAFEAAISSALNQSGQNQESTMGTFASIGSMIAMFAMMTP